MSRAATVVSSPARKTAGRGLVRWFYPFAAVLMLVLTLLGFRHFYIHGQSHPGREITPPIRTLIIVHGVAMSAWIVAFLVQPTLVALGKRRLHMALGRVGAAIAAAVFVLGLMVAVQSTRVAPPEAVIWGLAPRQFMAVPFLSILIFGGLVGAGVWNRRRPAVHRPMMFLATLAVMAAAVSRIDALSNLYTGTLWERVFGPFLVTLVIGAALVGARCALTRSFDRWLVGGFAGLTGACLLIMAVARTAPWVAFASMLAG